MRDERFKKKYIRRLGDRRDGRLVRKTDALHFVVPMLFPNRCDNEANIKLRIDLTRTNIFIDEKNAQNPEYKYKLFQIIVAAIAKTFVLRPRLNRFIKNGSTYERNKITESFVVKKEFSDNGGEALAVIEISPDDTLNTIRGKIYKEITAGRDKNKSDTSMSSMETFMRITPVPIAKAFANFVSFLDRYGKVFPAFIASDPYYTSVILSNLGSIGMKAGYHHLANWGTNSLFVAIGEIKKRPYFDEDGNATMKESVVISITVDERIADGYYYSKSVRLLKGLIENPRFLESPMKQMPKKEHTKTGKK